LQWSSPAPAPVSPTQLHSRWQTAQQPPRRLVARHDPSHEYRKAPSVGSSRIHRRPRQSWQRIDPSRASASGSAAPHMTHSIRASSADAKAGAVIALLVRLLL
jgi:hypothetical protein